MQGADSKMVLTYFDACNTGDIRELMVTMDTNIVHYFLPPVHRAIHGAEHLARYWSKFKRLFDPVWRIDHIIEAGDEVVSEWSCAYRPSGGGDRRMFRGTEWYVMRNGLIAEIRAYYNYDEARDCQLTDFNYAERGYLLK
jgi:ketosteroid isomerase-like protein